MRAERAKWGWNDQQLSPLRKLLKVASISTAGPSLSQLSLASTRGDSRAWLALHSLMLLFNEKQLISGLDAKTEALSSSHLTQH